MTNLMSLPLLVKTLESNPYSLFANHQTKKEKILTQSIKHTTN